jgi:hypothetical protein
MTPYIVLATLLVVVGLPAAWTVYSAWKALRRNRLPRRMTEHDLREIETAANVWNGGRHV